MLAGWPTRDSTPPGLSASAKTFVAAAKRSARAAPSSSSADTIPPKSLI